MLLTDKNKRKRMGHEIHCNRKKQNIANLKYIYIYIYIYIYVYVYIYIYIYNVNSAVNSIFNTVNSILMQTKTTFLI